MGGRGINAEVENDGNGTDGASKREREREKKREKESSTGRPFYMASNFRLATENTMKKGQGGH